MLKLVTGLPGAGKTSNELWDFLQNKDYASRPKFCTPIKGFIPADHGVTEIEHIDKWQELPEGSVILCDEVQRYCGTDIGREAPQWVQDFAIHRHSGKDLIFITQAPGFLHPFARKLVQPHVNYHRPYNLGRSMRYTWESVQTDPASKTARNLGQSQMVKTDKKVFDLYTSTVLDTHKARPPLKTIAVLGAAILLCLICFYFVIKYVMHYTGSEPETPLEAVATTVSKEAPAVPAPRSFGIPSAENKPVWTEETIKPRMAGNLYTAPVYDQLTAPTDFPRVAACMSSESRGSCNCYTQQGTPIDVPKSACLVFVIHGAFDPWFTSRNQRAQEQQSQSSEQPTAQPVTRAETNLGAGFTVVADNSHTERKTGIAK
ncbi:transposase [Pseudomonas gregormendelii]|uniref:Transposase n=1 Tax=Pseudomonas gregormendelii TaxID=1628277 RepID=A0ABS3AFZ8_9PSED|nr:zonular occludens toxin domain-containing protein [Pseudomonas gregormendelii]MBN3965808.1 transposase [Pseudomonas gregormendelii]MBN3965819.1 transposase [Pseudomonas gregormendelii]